MGVFEHTTGWLRQRAYVRGRYLTCHKGSTVAHSFIELGGYLDIYYQFTWRGFHRHFTYLIDLKKLVHIIDLKVISDRNFN